VLTLHTECSVAEMVIEKRGAWVARAGDKTTSAAARIASHMTKSLRESQRASTASRLFLSGFRG
jgi:hypothetical protein